MHLQIIPTEARDQLAMTSHNLTVAQYVDVIWAERNLDDRRPTKARSKSWPKTCFDKAMKGYVLAPSKSNITKLPVKGRQS